MAMMLPMAIADASAAPCLTSHTAGHAYAFMMALPCRYHFAERYAAIIYAAITPLFDATLRCCFHAFFFFFRHDALRHGAAVLMLLRLL